MIRSRAGLSNPEFWLFFSNPSFGFGKMAVNPGPRFQLSPKPGFHALSPTHLAVFDGISSTATCSNVFVLLELTDKEWCQCNSDTWFQLHLIMVIFIAVFGQRSCFCDVFRKHVCLTRAVNALTYLLTYCLR